MAYSPVSVDLDFHIPSVKNIFFHLWRVGHTGNQKKKDGGQFCHFNKTSRVWMMGMIITREPARATRQARRMAVTMAFFIFSQKTVLGVRKGPRPHPERSTRKEWHP